MRKALIFTLVLFVITVIGCGEKTTPETPSGATLKLDKSKFSPGETIKVHFTALSSYASNAWIGIIPSDVPHGSETENDKHDITYQYLKNMTSGSLTFKVPEKPGSYDFRMHDTDNNGKEVASIGFKVVEGTEGPTLKLDKTSFSPGEEIKVHFTAPSTYATSAWIGIIPSDIPHGDEAKNDEHDIAYKYLSKKAAGTLTFNAPEKPGSYDFRMNDKDSNGKEVAHVTFKVK